MKNPGAPADGHHVFVGAKLETQGTVEESEVLIYDQRIRESPVRCGKNMEEPILQFYLSHQPSTNSNQHHVEKASPAGFHLLFGGLDGPGTFCLRPSGASRSYPDTALQEHGVTPPNTLRSVSAFNWKIDGTPI